MQPLTAAEEATEATRRADEARRAWDAEYSAWNPDLSRLNMGARRVWDATVAVSITRLAQYAERNAAGFDAGLGSYAHRVNAGTVATFMGTSRDTVMRHWRTIVDECPRLLWRERRGDSASLRWPRLVAEALAASAASKELDSFCKAASREEPEGLHITVSRSYGEEPDRFRINCYIASVAGRDSVVVIVDRLLQALSTMAVCYRPEAPEAPKG